jgi:hypothetical protein
MGSRWKVLPVSCVLAAALVAAAAAGCHKSSASSGPELTDAEQSPKDYFLSAVYPRISSPTSCGGCHAGTPNSPCADSSCVFIAADGEATYALIEKTPELIAAPQKSPFLSYQHTDHNIKLTADQANVLGIWLGMEAAKRGLAGAVLRAKNLADAYDQFGACMNYDVFTSTGMADLPYTDTDFDGPCLGCHNGGQGSLWLAADPRSTFEQMRRFPFIQKFVVGRVDGDGNFKDLVPSGRIIEKANEPCPEGANGCHPQFGLSQFEQEAVQSFVNITLQNLAAGSCDNGVVTTVDAGIPDAGGGG